ncbi:general secretion pathway protein GspB [Herbaspirillum sp. ST 5-3]|uniref:general secretion pathway protein GspB n=1 Tax=Oxalobacteraceae TaxID=75682 RepID=UPI0010A3F44A|nr:general secretion pathway protein GspB [Herbaspirillum sp. ST 5-3]
MSYILDALRRAEAERRIGVSNPSYSPSVLAGRGERSASRWPRRWWIALPALAIAAAGGAWFGASQEKKPVAAATVPVVPAPQVQIAEKAPASSAKTAAFPAPVPKEAAAEPPASARESIAHKTPGRKTHPKTVESRPAPAPKAPEEPAVATLRELPAQIQGEIPSLTIGGYIYSSSKADRTVLINKTLLHEGDEVVPGLRLEKLMPNGMVLNYKGYRYRASY